MWFRLFPERNSGEGWLVTVLPTGGGGLWGVDMSGNFGDRELLRTCGNYFQRVLKTKADEAAGPH